MSDLRKPFYVYALRQPGTDKDFSFAFADWALEFWSEYIGDPKRVYRAYIEARRR